MKEEITEIVWDIEDPFEHKIILYNGDRRVGSIKVKAYKSKKEIIRIVNMYMKEIKKDLENETSTE
jgi:hypothetical protein